MSRTFHHGERRIRVRAIRRKQPDIRRLGKAIVELALEQAAAELEAERAHAAVAAAKQRCVKKREAGE